MHNFSKIHHAPGNAIKNIRETSVIVLHSFVKKTQKTPKKEIKLARQRLKEVKK